MDNRNRTSRVCAFKLENFMGFRDSGWIDLIDLTLIYGKNSVGKSAIVRALMLLRQSMDSLPNEEPLLFQADETVDLGSFENVIHGHEIQQDLMFTFRIELDAIEPFVRELTGDQLSDRVDEIELKLIYGLSKDAALKRIVIKGFQLDVQDYDAVLIGNDVKFVPKRSKTRILEWQADASVPFRSQIDLLPKKELEVRLKEGNENRNDRPDLIPALTADIWRQITPCRLNGFIRLLGTQGIFDVKTARLTYPDFDIVDQWLQYCRDSIYAFLQSIIYISPLRNRPRRFYYAPQFAGRSLNANDDAFIIRQLTTQSHSDVVKLWLEGSELTAVVEPEEIRTGLYSVNLKYKDGKELVVNLRDVGFGVSQALPVILAAMTLPKDAWLIVEQPELHLHPASQGALADIFVSLVLQGRRFLIETHSEHFLLRIQRRIAEHRLALLEAKEAEVSLDNLPIGLEMKQFGIVFVQRSPITGESSVSNLKT